MYRSYNNECGTPPRIYRTPSEIRADIKEISESIDETLDMLNVRDMLLNMIISENRESPEKLVLELASAISEAESAQRRLSGLREELSMLEDELVEVRELLRR